MRIKDRWNMRDTNESTLLACSHDINIYRSSKLQQQIHSHIF